MKSSTGRWVDGDNFFGRETEMALLESRIRDGNHVLLTGQRRMGKTSISKELGRRLRDEGWVFLFTDVEDAACAEDVIAEIAQAAHPIQPISSRLAVSMRHWFGENVDEISALDFRVKFRAGLDSGSWRRHGEQLMRNCAEQDHPVLLVIDELPIFLKRILKNKDGVERVDEFLSWLRRIFLQHNDGSLVFIVSGSIGLKPLVERLGLPDRINHLEAFRLGPWNRTDSARCFQRLAESYELRIEEGVAQAVHDRLGIGIPHHVQSFFARLRDFAVMQRRDEIGLADVAVVYETELLGPAGQNDLVHYETRLKEGLEDGSYSLAMQILAEAAIRGAFTPQARRCLDVLYAPLVDDVRARITNTLDVLEHDGYLYAGEAGYEFPSQLLKDWWAARFRDHHTPLCDRLAKSTEQLTSGE